MNSKPQPSLLVAGAFLFTIVLAGALAPWITPYDPQRLLDPILLASRYPSVPHPFGTDPYSRDLLSRMIAGARVSLLLAITSVAFATIAGTCTGILSGYAGGFIDRLLMRLVDVGLAVPRVLLLLTIVGVWGTPSLFVLGVVLGATGWMGTARLVRGEVRVLRAGTRVMAARALGLRTIDIVRGHLLPEVLPLVVVTATFGFGQLLLLESGLSFLGIGVQPPLSSWGTILLDVSDVVGPRRWLIAGPGLILIATVLAVYRIGDALQSALESPAGACGTVQPYHVSMQL